MNCSDFNRLLDNYENLSSEELDEMNNHAQNCENCKSELEFYKSIMLAAASLPVPEPPADLIGKVNNRIDNLPKHQSGFDKVINNFRCNVTRYAAAAACIAVGVIVGLNGRSIGNMLNPKGDVNPDIPVVDVADAGNTDRDTADSNVPAADEEQALPDMPSDTAEIAAAAASAVAPEIDVFKGTSTVLPSKPGIVSSEVIMANSGSAAVTPSDPETVPVMPTDAPAPVTTTSVPTNGKTSRYTIARENYHIPTPSNETAAAATEAPVENVQINPSERYQIAMGNYEIPEAEKKAIRNKLIVSEADIDDITLCMSEAGVKGTADGYEASASAFGSFLAMLDARGIYYNYAEASSDGVTVSFILLAN